MTTTTELLAALKELREAAHDDRACLDRIGPLRGGCKDCERYSNKGPFAAKQALERAGFARVIGGAYPGAVSVEALTAALEGLLPVDTLGRCFRCNFQPVNADMMHVDNDNLWDGDQPCLDHEVYVDARKALATVPDVKEKHDG